VRTSLNRTPVVASGDQHRIDAVENTLIMRGRAVGSVG
jgi:hypothetical protein